jgi:hypothetical protein
MYAVPKAVFHCGKIFFSLLLFQLMILVTSRIIAATIVAAIHTLKASTMEILDNAIFISNDAQH